MTLYGASYPNFSTKELLSIEKNSGKAAKERVYNYKKKIKSFEQFSELKKLSKVNIYINKLPYQADTKLNDSADYWATPKEFLTKGFGDCEDYVITKYFTLLKLGFEKEKLFMTLAYDKYSKQNHMVLSYFIEAHKPPLILDSLSHEVLNLNKRVDLSITVFINDKGVYTLSSNNELTKTKYRSKKFRDLLKRVKVES